MPPAKWALPFISSAIELAHTLRIFEALCAKVRVSCTVIGSQTAALVAFELDKGEAMLSAEVFFTDSLLSQCAVSANHLLVMILHFLLDSFHGAVRVAPKEGIVAAIALIVESQLFSDFFFLLYSLSITILRYLVSL